MNENDSNPNPTSASQSIMVSSASNNNNINAAELGPLPTTLVSQTPAVVAAVTEYIDETPFATTQTAQVQTSDTPAEVKNNTEKQEQIESGLVMPKQNVTITEPVFSPVEKFNPALETIDLPSDFTKVIAATLDRLPNIAVADTASSRNWAEVLKEGQDHSSYNGAYITTLEDPEADFGQTVALPTGLAGGAFPKFAASTEAPKGEKALMRLNAYMGLGSIFKFPLWNTGIWLTLKPPSEAALLELNRLNISDKITFGRTTYGLALNNMSSVVADRMTNFVLEHVYQTNLKNKDVNLRSIISTQDLNTLIWGLLNTVYPTGVQYRRSCSCNPEKCQHVVSERLNVSKIAWTNKRGLTSLQMSHMSNSRSDSVDLAAVEAYKKELLAAQKRTITLTGLNGKEISLTLKVPTIAEYIDSGQRWISEITSSVNKALAQNVTNDERNSYIMNHGQVSAMLQYIHWIDTLTFDGADIDDVETIEKLLTALSSDDLIRTGFMDELDSYINQSTISVIGIPTYDCPACGEEQKPAKVLPNHSNIIPLDVYQLFFTLLVQRLERIQVR